LMEHIEFFVIAEGRLVTEYQATPDIKHCPCTNVDQNRNKNLGAHAHQRWDIKGNRH
jgi:hypothetical protein